MVPNPAEVFELTKFGTSYAYIKADVNSTAVNNKDWYQGSDFLRYNFQKNDINVYEATEFVHGYLEDDTSRTPEQVKIIFDPNDDGSENSAIYKVRRGQSMLYSAFKAWRELKLLENSVLLNRVTKSSIVRILGIEVGDMPKEMVQPHLQGIKSLIEQKSSLNTDQSMNEYTNPGPIENNIYVPTHNGVGAINMQTIGGDVDVKGLADLDYFKDRVFGCLRGDTLISFADGSTQNVEDIVFDKENYLGKDVICCDSDGNIKNTKLIDAMMTKKHANFIRIELENGKYVDVTPDHLMMLKDGTFKEAQYLTEEDELMGEEIQ